MGYRIKELRESLNWTQTELSEKSGVSRGIISSLENNTATSTSTKTLLKIAQAFGVTIGQLFFEKGV